MTAITSVFVLFLCLSLEMTLRKYVVLLLFKDELKDLSWSFDDDIDD